MIRMLIISTIAAGLAILMIHEPKYMNWITNYCPLLMTIGSYFHAAVPWYENFGKSGPGPKDREGFPVTHTSKYNWLQGPKFGGKLRMYTDDDIKYVDGKTMYLVILGHVFDVTKGYQYYKPGSGYSGFIGQDGTRAFVTGEFNEEGFVSDITDLKPGDYLGLYNWLKFYLDHHQYKHVGYHAGIYYTAEGKEQPYMTDVKRWMENALKAEKDEADLKELFPPCNIEWNATTGSKFWCSETSGGVSRDWAGYPRKFSEDGVKPVRCACVHANYLGDPRVAKYDNCDASEKECFLPPEKKT